MYYWGIWLIMLLFGDIPDHWEKGQNIVFPLIELKKDIESAVHEPPYNVQNEFTDKVQKLIDLDKKEEAWTLYLDFCKQYPGSSFNDTLALKIAQGIGHGVQLYTLEGSSYPSAIEPKILVSSIGLKETKFSVWKLPIKELISEGIDPHPPASALAKLGKKVTEWNQTLNDKVEGFCGKINLPIKEPGFYGVEAGEKWTYGYTVLFISDLSMIVKRDENRVFIWVTPQKGKNLNGPYEIYAIQGREIIYSGCTNSSGIFVGTIKGDPTVPITWLAIKGEHAALSDSTWYRYEHALERCYVYTDQHVYLPKQNVHIKIIHRRFDPVLKSYVLNKNEEIDVLIQDPFWRVLLRKKVTTNSMGTAILDFSIPQTSRIGLYSIRVQGAFLGEGFFHVTDFSKLLKIKVKTSHEIVFKGESIPIEVTSCGDNGEPVTGEVIYQIYSRPLKPSLAWIIPETRKPTFVTDGKGELDKSGNFCFEFSTKDVKPSIDEDFFYEIWVQVRSKGREVYQGYTNIKVFSRDLKLQLSTDKEFYFPGEKIQIMVKAFDCKGFPYKVEKLKLEWSHGEESRVIHEGFTDNKEWFEFLFQPEETGLFRLTAKYVDNEGRVINTFKDIWIIAAMTSLYSILIDDELSINIQKKIYRSGETIRGFTSSYYYAPLFMTCESDEVLAYRVLQVRGNIIFFNQKIIPDFSPITSVVLSLLCNYRFIQKQDTIALPPQDKLLKVKIIPPKDIEKDDKFNYLSLGVRVQDASGYGVQAELSLSIVDRTTSEFQGKKVDDIRKFFHGIRFGNVLTSHSLTFPFFKDREQPFITSPVPKKPIMMNTPNNRIVWNVPAMNQNFDDSIYWEGQLSTDSKGRVSIKCKLPDTSHSWLITATTIDSYSRVGVIHAELTVPKDSTQPVIKEFSENE